MTQVAEHPVVKTARQHEEKAKPSWDEAFNRLKEESMLQQIVDGNLPHTQWGEAVSHDMAQANQFIRDFVDDLSVITGCKLECNREVMPDALTSDFATDKKRVEKLNEQIQHQFSTHVHEIIDNLQCKRNRVPASFEENRRRHVDSKGTVAGSGTLNISPVQWGNSIASFNHAPDATLGGINAKRFKITLANPALKSPDDFTRKVPVRITKKLATLKGLHYDYQPKILDGFLVGMEENTEHADSSMTRLMNNVRYVLEDPALTITINSRQYAIDFWKEPFASEAEEARTRLSNSKVLPVFIAILFMIGITYGWWFHTSMDGFLNGVISIVACVGMVGSVIAVIGTLADWFGTRRHKWTL